MLLKMCAPSPCDEEIRLILYKTQ